MIAKKLSKRHGATSVSQYREQNYLPEAMNNYLTLLGWSHPEEVDIFTKEEITNIFGLERFLNRLLSMILKNLSGLMDNI